MSKVFSAMAVSVDGYFQQLPEHFELRLVEAVPAPGDIHLHYEVER
jgi:hypothetical protein